jgi:hypothetical protein
MSRTREERRRQKAQRIVHGVAFGLILLFCFWYPGFVEYIVEDTPAGIYAEVSE